MMWKGGFSKSTYGERSTPHERPHLLESTGGKRRESGAGPEAGPETFLLPIVISRADCPAPGT